jgi:membrane fusion protein (multidrug efflux system)
MTQLTSMIQPTADERRRRYRRRMSLMLILVTLVFGSVFGMKWFGNKMTVQYINNMPVPPVTITAGGTRSMRWDNSLQAIGTLVPVQGTEVTTESGGIVKEIHFESGAQVRKGERLVTLDAANERGEYKRLQAQAQLAELNRARREKLYKLEAISRSDYDAAVSEANAARAAVEGQAGKLALKEIRAPFSGQLGIRRVNLGEYVQPGQPMVTLQSLHPIDVDFALPEHHTGTVAPGFAVGVKVDAYPERVFPGKVLAVEPRVDEATRSFALRARLDNAELKLRPGQFGEVRLSLPGERQLTVVPRTAVNYSSYGTSVFVVQKKKDAPPPAPPAPGQPPATDLEVVQRFVKTGEARGDFVAVLEGLREGEQIATSGLLKLRNGQPVIINNTIEPKPELNPTVPPG